VGNTTEQIHILRSLAAPPPLPPQLDTLGLSAAVVLMTLDGHNRRWIDGSIPMLSIDSIDRYYRLILSIDTIGHADHQ
jgi:hypothetical protein